MAIARPNIQVTTKQFVIRETSMKPYVGFEHPTDTPDGWRYDIKRWCSPFDLKLPSLPRLSDSSIQGVSESTYFRSGVGAVSLGDLYLRDFEEIFNNGERHWYPEITHGTYFRYHTDYFYYGDNSRIQYIDTANNRDSRNYIELDKTPDFSSPILAATFKRNSVKESLYNIRVQQKYRFTGTYSGGEELTTVSDLGSVTWTNVDTTKKEFFVDGQTIDGLTRLWFNNDYTVDHGVVPAVYGDLSAAGYLGLSTGRPYQVFYLPYFPVLSDSSFHVYIADSTTWTEWVKVDSWWDLIQTDWATKNKYFLDSDLGIVYFGSASDGGVPSVGTHIVAAYTSTLRIEYEEADKDTIIIAEEADVNPVTQSVNQGFVCISHSEIEAANITLAIDKSRILGTSPTEYGPITVGSDYALLKATVTSASGLPVPNIEVDFKMSPDTLGYLNGSASTISVTDGSGKAYTTYQPPVSSDDIGFYTIDIRASNHASYTGTHKDVIIKMNETGLEGKEDELYIYKIIKDDILQGYDSIDDYVADLISAGEQPNWVVDTDSIEKWTTELIIENGWVDWVAPAESLVPIAGRKVVIYEYDATAINPVTGVAGAYVPLRPTLLEKIPSTDATYPGRWRAIYPNAAIPDLGAAITDPGGYWLVSSRILGFQASCWGPYYNRDISSNTIRARVSLPDYLLGEYVNTLDLLVPFGWKVLGDDDNVAAGLDGATFITVNPHSGPYDIIDLVGGTGLTGDFASAPDRTISFGFTIV